MMNKFKRKFAAYTMTSLVALSATPALALDSFWTPLQLSLTPPLQIPNDSCTVYGLSLGILRVGVHTKVAKDVLGLDDEDVVGLQIAGYDSYSRELYGAQLSGFFSSNSKSLVGFQMSCIGNFADDIPFGFQLAGLANYLKNDLGFGLQLAGVCNECRSGTGLQAALGWNQCVSGVGLQMAIANTAINEFTGVQFGLFNWGEGQSGRVEKRHEVLEGRIQSYGRPANFHQGVRDMRGLQVGLANKSSDLYGVQCGLIWNDVNNISGLQFGALNTAEVVTGIQIGLLNSHPRIMTGVQWGIINRADHVTGVQLGIFNRAETMTGIQLGLLNVITENTVLLLPVINAHF